MSDLLFNEMMELRLMLALGEITQFAFDMEMTTLRCEMEDELLFG